MNTWQEAGDTPVFPILNFFPVPSLPIASVIKCVMLIVLSHGFDQSFQSKGVSGVY